MSESGKDPGFKVFALSAVEVGKEVVFDPQPESFDGIEVGAVGRQVLRFKVMPTQRFGFVPTGVVHDENLSDSLFVRILLGKRIEKDLENIGVAVLEHQ